MSKENVVDVVDIVDDVMDAEQVEQTMKLSSGLQQGLIITSIAIGAGAIVYLGYKGGVYLKGKWDERKHKKTLEDPEFEEIVDEETEA